MQIETYETRLTSANALELFKGYDVILDGTDNFATRYLVNDACVLLKIPNAYGSIFRFEGQASVFATVGGPCYRCLYPEPPPPGLVPSCAEGGVLGVLPGVIGTIQATEALKLVLGAGSTLVGRLLLYDAWTMKFRELKLRRDPACPICGDHPSIKGLIDYEEFCGVRPAAATAAAGPGVPETTVEELKARVDKKAPFFLLDVREPHEFQISRIAGSTLIPLGQLPARLGEMPVGAGDRRPLQDRARAAPRPWRILKENGIEAKNLKGGILAWIDKVDPTLAKSLAAVQSGRARRLPCFRDGNQQPAPSCSREPPTATVLVRHAPTLNAHSTAFRAGVDAGSDYSPRQSRIDHRRLIAGSILVRSQLSP